MAGSAGIGGHRVCRSAAENDQERQTWWENRQMRSRASAEKIRALV